MKQNTRNVGLLFSNQNTLIILSFIDGKNSQCMFSRCIFEINSVKFVNEICALKGFDKISRIEN